MNLLISTSNFNKYEYVYIYSYRSSIVDILEVLKSTCDRLLDWGGGGVEQRFRWAAR